LPERRAQPVEVRRAELLPLGDEQQRVGAVLNVDATLSLNEALDLICAAAEAAVREGKLILMLSDRYLQPDKLPVHALLATGAVHHHLVKIGLRCDANILVETGVARDPHHFACLIGYGATAVYPYLVYQSLHSIAQRGNLDKQQQLGRGYRRGVRKGLFKVMSKMGISSISSYRGAQLFEIVGLHKEIVDRCFRGTASRIQGANFEDLLADQKKLAAAAWEPREPIKQGGLLKYVHGGEYHCFNPDVVTTLQAAVRSGDYERYKVYATLVNDRPIATLRDLMTLRAAGPAVPIDEVESIEAIMPRFDSAGMSLGALSPEAHEALAIAMNRIGARSKSGEGGEELRMTAHRLGGTEVNAPLPQSRNSIGGTVRDQSEGLETDTMVEVAEFFGVDADISTLITTGRKE
jgi:glutamate synthase (NADPH/NADH) large chain